MLFVVSKNRKNARIKLNLIKIIICVYLMLSNGSHKQKV